MESNFLVEHSNRFSDVTDDGKGFCPICFEEKEMSFFYHHESTENFQIKPCGHRFCEDCFSKHVTTVVDSGAWQVRCPGESCKYTLSARDVENILSADKYEKWQATRNTSFRERFMMNDKEMRDALKVDKRVETEVKRREKRKRLQKDMEAAEAMMLRENTKKKKFHFRHFRHGVRVNVALMSAHGPRQKTGTILEVNESSMTASIIYDDGEFWGFAPLTYIHVLPQNETSQLPHDMPFLTNGGEALLEEEVLEEEEIVEGRRVTAGWINGDVYPGVIASVNRKEKTATINYDDGDVWDKCPFHKIREEQSSLKCCPQCVVIIYKYDGCDSMTCLCGENFDWKTCCTIPPKLMDELVEVEVNKRENEAKTDMKICSNESPP